MIWSTYIDRLIEKSLIREFIATCPITFVVQITQIPNTQLSISSLKVHLLFKILSSELIFKILDLLLVINLEANHWYNHSNNYFKLIEQHIIWVEPAQPSIQNTISFTEGELDDLGIQMMSFCFLKEITLALAVSMPQNESAEALQVTAIFWRYKYKGPWVWALWARYRENVGLMLILIMFLREPFWFG